MTPDQKFIIDIHDLLIRIKNDYDSLIAIYPDNDIRPAFLGLTGNVIHSLLLHLMSAEDTFTRPEWWRLRFNKNNMSKKDFEAVKESASVTKHAYFVIFFSRIETLQRKTINLILPGFDINPKKPKRYNDIYKNYFNSLGLSKYINLFAIANHIRNTIHSNGIFLSHDSSDLFLEWKGRKFEFKHMQSIDFMSVDNFLFLINELLFVIKEILKAPLLQKYNFIEDKYH